MCIVVGIRTTPGRSFGFYRFSTSRSYNCQDYCRELVKKADYFNYLCCLPLPQHQRRLAFALRAFNVEISLIRDRAPNPQTANIRFQYWEDSIYSLFRENGDYTIGKMVHRSPIESELSWAAEKFTSHFHRHWLLRLVKTRRERTGDIAFQNYEELEEYADSTNAPIHYALAEAFGHKSLAVDHALSHLSKAQGIVTHLRSVVPIACQRRSLILPTDLLVHHELSTELILRLCRGDKQIGDPLSSERLRDLCQYLATRARDHAAKALSTFPSNSKGQRRTPPPLPLLLLPLVPVIRMLKVFANPCNFDPRHPQWLQPQLEKGLMPLRVAWYAARGSTLKPP